MVGPGERHVYRLRGEKNTGPVLPSVEPDIVRALLGRILYKPFAVLIGVLGGIVGRKAFDFVWTKIDDEEPPGALTRDVAWPRLLGAAALEGMIFRTTRYAVERYGARGWYYLTGNWPGPKDPKPDE